MTKDPINFMQKLPPLFYWYVHYHGITPPYLTREQTITSSPSNRQMGCVLKGSLTSQMKTDVHLAAPMQSAELAQLFRILSLFESSRSLNFFYHSSTTQTIRLNKAQALDYISFIIHWFSSSSTLLPTLTIT